MISNFLLVAGLFVLAMALRSFRSPALYRLGYLGVVAASFCAGWLLGGSVPLGLGFAALWLLLPWVEILTRLRRLRIPSSRVLEPCPAPSRHDFPGLEDFSAEIERAGFEEVADLGCEECGGRVFWRIFRGPGGHTHAAICLTERPEISFYYLTLTSRLKGGRVFMTWNYPFTYGLKFSPGLAVRRVEGEESFAALVENHKKLLAWHGVAETSAESIEPGRLAEVLQNDFRSQIRHNLAAGLLREEGADSIRYTFRGMLYLWLQFLRDLFSILP